MLSFLSKKFEQLFDIVKGISTLDTDSLNQLLSAIKIALIEADVPLVVIDDFLESIKNKCLGIKLSKALQPKEYVSKVIYDELIISLGGKNNALKRDFLSHILLNKRRELTVIMMAGLQGAGKTTTISKFINRVLSYPKQGNLKQCDIACVSVDYYRPAAREQLKILSTNLGVDCYEYGEKTPLLEAQRAIENAKKDKKKIIFIDTAGRTVIDQAMMIELQDLAKAIKPDANVLVIDIMSGQKGLEIAKSFVDTITINGIVISKVDSNAPGGIIFGLAKTLEAPIIYSSYGEKPSDIDVFDPVRSTERMLGMGDLLGFAENATTKIAQSEEDMIKNAIQRGDITIEEFLKILQAIEKMGPMKHLVGMMPKDLTGGKTISDDHVAKIEDENRKFKIMCSSMNQKERKTPDLVVNNESRKIRIAKGSGLSKTDINQLLDKYKQMREAMKPMRSMMKYFM
jgi:signal recognition particle subunit SRP54